MSPHRSAIQKAVASLRMVVAIDSAMLLSVVRRLSAYELKHTANEFLEAIEALNIKALFSEMDEEAIQSAHQRRDWWVGMIAGLVADRAVEQSTLSSGKNSGE